MYRLGALMTVAAAAAPSAFAETSEEGNYSESRQLRGFGRKKLVATVKGGAGQSAFEATVTADKKSRSGKVVWTVKIDNDDIQCDAYNWHIHAKPIQGDQSSGPDCGSTGGHTDNSLMCGPATDRKEDCRGVYGCDGATSTCFADAYGERCNMGIWAFRGELSQAQASLLGCEYGDLSGKMGKIETTLDTQTFEDYHLESLSTYRDMSIVFHCCTASGCSPRVACGDFEYKRIR